MIFLPVVERELRVAARKRGTYWVRVIAAAVALVIGAGFLVLARVTPFGFAGASAGLGLFVTLTWLSLAGALCAGVFLTSDCLSEEKRDGTIGLLFLTDLRGHDVVLGKLLATSLRAGCALLGIFPILAITLLMGGVSATQFWRTCLALASALLLSLSAGLFVSAISRVSQKALTATLLLLVILAAAGPLADAIFAASKGATFNPVLSHSSPVFLHVAATRSGPTPDFWPGLIANALVTGALLSFAFILLPRSWQQKNLAATTPLGSWIGWWKFGGAGVREKLRQRLMELNPVLWLACRERWQAAALWIIAFLQVGAFAAVFHRMDGSNAWMAWSYLAGLLTLFLYLGLASHAGRFFVEARRCGLIELVLATPVTPIEIVRGQWRALLRLFALPLGICLATQLIANVLVQWSTWDQIASTTATATAPGPIPSPSTNPPPSASVSSAGSTNFTVAVIPGGTFGTGAAVSSGFEPPGYVLALIMAGAGILTAVADLIAIAWFGMWMGLTSKSTNLATLKTILFVQVIPWFVISFSAGLIIPLMLIPTMISGGSISPTRLMVWFPLLSTGLATILSVALDAIFITWARRRLHGQLRERVCLRVASVAYPAAS